MPQDPSRMSADEIVQEIQSLRRDIDQSVQRVTELSLLLYGRARRRNLAVSGGTEPEDPVPYIVFANGWARMASSLRQGLQRMSRVDRVFAGRVQEEPAPIALPVVREVPRATVPDNSMEELVALYGGEFVNDALSR